MGRRSIAVDAEVLGDLCALVDRLLEYGHQDDATSTTTFIGVPKAHVSALRGSVAEIRVHALVAA